MLGEGFDVVGVVTQPDKSIGRSRSTVVPSPVKQVAIEEGLVVLQPEKPRGDVFLSEMRALGAELSIVVAYGHILPQPVIDMPAMGTLNIHASLLPALRGAAPIQAAIRDGLTETGVTIMRMVPALDAGPMLHRVTAPIFEDETYGELQMRLSELGAQALIESLSMLSVGRIVETGQDHALATHAPKVDRDAAQIDWTRGAREISRLIRAYDPKPGAWTTLRGASVKLFGARHFGGARAEAGRVLDLNAEGMIVAGGDGALRIDWVHPAGKKRLRAADWAAGRGVAVGDTFGS